MSDLKKRVEAARCVDGNERGRCEECDLRDDIMTALEAAEQRIAELKLDKELEIQNALHFKGMWDAAERKATEQGRYACEMFDALKEAQQRIAELEAPLPDDVEQVIKNLRKHEWNDDIADMLKRLAQEAVYNRNVMEAETIRANKAEKRIADLKRQLRIWKRNAKNRQARVEELRTPLPDEIQQALGRCEEEMTYDLIERLYRENKRLDAALADAIKALEYHESGAYHQDKHSSLAELQGRRREAYLQLKAAKKAREGK